MLGCRNNQRGIRATGINRARCILVGIELRQLSLWLWGEGVGCYLSDLNQVTFFTRKDVFLSPDLCLNDVLTFIYISDIMKTNQSSKIRNPKNFHAYHYKN